MSINNSILKLLMNIKGVFLISLKLLKMKDHNLIFDEEFTFEIKFPDSSNKYNFTVKSEYVII